jgi:rod shape determining protein RodA
VDSLFNHPNLLSYFKFALAKLLSDVGSKFQDFKTKLKAFFIIIIPAILIAVQPDPGTMLVFTCFIFVLYREGFLEISC